MGDYQEAADALRRFWGEAGYGDLPEATTAEEVPVPEEAEEDEDFTYLRSIGILDRIVDFLGEMALCLGVQNGHLWLWYFRHIRFQSEGLVHGYVLSQRGYPIIAGTDSEYVYCLDLPRMTGDEPAVVLIYPGGMSESTSLEEIGRRMMRVADSFPEFICQFVAGTLPYEIPGLEDDQ